MAGCRAVSCSAIARARNASTLKITDGIKIGVASGHRTRRMGTTVILGRGLGRGRAAAGSRLESGQRRPTLELLLPLARAYGVPIDEPVGAPPTGDPWVHLRPVTRNGMTMVPLTRRADGVQAYKLIIPAASQPVIPEPQTHEGYEWVYVLSGRLRLVLGDQDLVLTPGEAAEFDTRVPRWFDNARRRTRRNPQPLRPTGRTRTPTREIPACRVDVAQVTA